MINEDKNLKSAKNFTRRLAQTILWCAPRADISNPEYCLRTRKLRPQVFEQDRFSAVDTVAVERERYSDIEFRHAQIPKDLGGGRLLVYFPNINLEDGAAEVETAGFLDTDNLPGWDTWVAFFEDETETSYGSYLIAWIPPEFIKTVSNGIFINPEECIMWLSETKVKFAQELRREGLLA